jgi:flagellar M-ring protein FliF
VAPIVGAANIHAEVTADVDFSHSEQAAESYKPNQTPDSATIRSTQTSESSNGNGNASGIPGAATNQPPAPATAPITAPATAAATAAASSIPATPTTTQKDATINYEVDKTIRYVQQPMGGLKRLSVAVVVNYKQTTDKSGKVKNIPLTSAEQSQISDLVKEAMGYSQARGDTLNIVNSQFLVNKETPIPEMPIWKQPDNINMAKEFGKYLLAFLAIMYLYKKVLKPLIEKFNEPQRKHHINEQGVDVEDDDEDEGSEVHLSNAAPPPGSSYQSHLDNAKQMAKENPKVVASVVKVWVNGNE